MRDLQQLSDECAALVADGVASWIWDVDEIAALIRVVQVAQLLVDTEFIRGPMSIQPSDLEFLRDALAPFRLATA